MTDRADQPTPDWARIDALLDQALELEGEARAAFLAELDPPMRTQLERVLTGQGEAVVDELLRRSLDGAEPDSAGVPEQVGPWRLERALGAGGMAQVFEARRAGVDFEQRAAVKILWPYRSDAHFQERLIQERRILASLNHPGIAGLLDGGVLPDHRPWFAMEYVEGERIDTWCKGKELDAVLDVFTQVCEAVEFAHGRLVVHRDLKPANILVGGDGRVKLLDFGIAKMMDATEDPALTRTGGSLLTLQYASPEQVTRAPITVASDVYQLGVLFYQLLTGTVPYDLGELSLKQAIETICHRAPPPPSAHAAGLDRDLDAICQYALRKDPARRYASVSDLARDVQMFRENRPVSARPQGRGYVFRRFVRRNAAPLGAVATAFVLLAAATAFSVQQAKRAQQEAERSARALQVLSGVFAQADPFKQAGPEVTLGEALVQRYPDIVEDVAADPALAWQVHSQLGFVFTQLEMNSEAEQAYRHALAAAEALESPPGPMALTASAGVASALNGQGRFPETLAFTDPWVTVPAADAASARARAYLLLAEVGALLPQHGLDRAGQRLDEVVGLVEHHGLDEPELLYLLEQKQSRLAADREDFEASAAHARRAAEWAGETGRHGARAMLIQNLGIQLGRQGRFDEARPLFLEAMAIVDEHAPGHPHRLTFAVNYAGLLFRTGQHDEAVHMIRSSLAGLEGTQDRHLWAFANRDLATYAFATGEIQTSLEANRQVLLAAPDLYGLDSPRSTVARLFFARHLSFAGLHEAALAVVAQAITAQPRLGSTSLEPFMAELRLDAAETRSAVDEFNPAAHPDDPNARLLALKFACAVNDSETLAVRLAAIDPADLGDGHLDQRLRAWHALLGAPLSPDRGPGLVLAFETLAATPRLSSLEHWRLLRELVPMYGEAGLPATVQAAWAQVRTQRAIARRVLLDDYLPADAPVLDGVVIYDEPAREPRLPCLL